MSRFYFGLGIDELRLFTRSSGSEPAAEGVIQSELFSSVSTARISILRGLSLQHFGQVYIPVFCARSSDFSLRQF